MSPSTHDKKQFLTRLHRIQGQLSALEQAIVANQDCTQLLQQLAASRGAINGLMRVVLEDHLRHHLKVQEGHEETGGMEVLLDILKSYLK